MARTTGLSASVESLEALASRLDDLALPEGEPGESAVRQRDQAVRTIRSYVMPRLLDPATPLTVVFAGPTGAGKSTLLNSVAGAELTATGPLRPTTRSPVVFASADRADSYLSIGGVECEVVRGRLPILAEMTLVDTPDIDSTSVGHRSMAEALIDNADLVVFVSSALRYADRVPWEVLRRARSRGAPVICVLNRIRANSDGSLNDYRSLLRTEGLGDEVLAIGEHHLADGAYSVPPGSVRDLRKQLVSQVEAHRSAASETLQRVLSATCSQALEVIETAGAASTRRDSAEIRVAERIRLNDGPFLDEFSPGGLPADEVGALLGLSPRRVRRWARRSFPPGEVVARERLRFTEALIASQEVKLRRIPGPYGHSEGFSHSDYEVLRFAVERWLLTPIDLPEPIRGVDGELVELLVRIGAVVGSTWPDDMTEVLAPKVYLSEVAPLVADSLRKQLDPVYERARKRAIGSALEASSSAEEIDLTRAAVSEVFARVSFANA